MLWLSIEVISFTVKPGEAFSLKLTMLQFLMKAPDSAQSFIFCKS